MLRVITLTVTGAAGLEAADPAPRARTSRRRAAARRTALPYFSGEIGSTSARDCGIVRPKTRPVGVNRSRRTFWNEVAAPSRAAHMQETTEQLLTAPEATDAIAER